MFIFVLVFFCLFYFILRVKRAKLIWDFFLFFLCFCRSTHNELEKNRWAFYRFQWFRCSDVINATRGSVCVCVCGCVCVCVRKCVWVGFLGFSCWLWSDDFLVLNGNEICLRTDHSGPAVPHVISNFHRIFHFSSCFPPSTQAHFQFSFRLSIFLSFFATANISLFRLPSTLLIFTIPTPFQAISIQNNEYSIFYRIWDMRIFACFFRSIFLFIFVSFFLSL